MNKILVLFAIVLACHAIHLHQAHEAGVDLPPGTVNLVADNGQFLKLCHDCGGAKADSASVQASSGDKTIDWNLQTVAGGKVAFKGSNGLYLSRCNECWNGGEYSDSAFVHMPDSSEPYSQWTPILHSNGKYSFLSDNGKYLARCNVCTDSSSSSNFAFVHQADSGSPWAQWDVVYKNLPKQGTVQLPVPRSQ